MKHPEMTQKLRLGEFQMTGAQQKIPLQAHFKEKLLSLPTNEVSILKQTVLGRTNRLLSSIRHGPYRKRCFQQFCAAVGTSLSSCYLAMTEGIHIGTQTDGTHYEVRR
jgi:hypothetical protein